MNLNLKSPFPFFFMRNHYLCVCLWLEAENPKFTVNKGMRVLLYCHIRACYPWPHCHIFMSLDTHVVRLLWGQCAFRDKLPFSIYASIITLTSEKADLKHWGSPLKLWALKNHGTASVDFLLCQKCIQDYKKSQDIFGSHKSSFVLFFSSDTYYIVPILFPEINSKGHKL